MMKGGGGALKQLPPMTTPGAILLEIRLKFIKPKFKFSTKVYFSH